MITQMWKNCVVTVTEMESLRRCYLLLSERLDLLGWRSLDGEQLFVGLRLGLCLDDLRSVHRRTR